MLNYLKIIVFIFFLPNLVVSQSYWFGAKSGLGLNTQKWDDFSNRDFLLSPFGDVFLESFNDQNVLYAQLGYHIRGSSVRFRTFQGLSDITEGFKFKNLVLELGAKKFYGNTQDKFRPFLILGIRGEYTLGTNLDDFASYNSAFFPFDEYVRKINYGVSFGGGYEWFASEFQKLFIEVSVNPDFSYQYDQPIIQDVINPITNQIMDLPTRTIRNLSFEIKIGMKFLRKVVYVN